MGDETDKKDENIAKEAPLNDEKKTLSTPPPPPPAAPPPPTLKAKTTVKSPTVIAREDALRIAKGTEDEIKKEQKRIEKETKALIDQKEQYKRAEFREKRFLATNENIKALDTEISDAQQRIKLKTQRLATAQKNPKLKTVAEQISASIEKEQADLQTLTDSKAEKIAALEAFAKEYKQKIEEFDASIQIKNVYKTVFQTQLLNRAAQPSSSAGKPDDVKKKYQLEFANNAQTYTDMTSYSEEEQLAIILHYNGKDKEGNYDPANDAMNWGLDRVAFRLASDIKLQIIDYEKFKAIIGRPLPFEQATPVVKQAAKVKSPEMLDSRQDENVVNTAKVMPQTEMQPTSTQTPTTTAPLPSSRDAEPTAVISTETLAMPVTIAPIGLKELYQTVNILFNEHHEAFKRLDTCQKHYDKLQQQAQSYFAYFRAPSAQDIEGAKRALSEARVEFESTLMIAREKGEELNTRVRSQFSQYAAFVPLPMTEKQKMLAEQTPKALAQFIEFMEYELLRAQQNVKQCQETQMKVESQIGYFYSPSATTIDSAQMNLESATHELNEAAQTLALAKQAHSQRETLSKSDKKDQRASLTKGFESIKQKPSIAVTPEVNPDTSTGLKKKGNPGVPVR